jgi:GT2 family glycosyltransferase
MDNRIMVVHLEKNQGISAASNAALSLASGEFIGLLDHDDELKPDALYEVVSLLNRDRDLDFIYSDEDKKAPDGRLVQAFFKPDWSPELLLSTNYVPHFAVYRKSLVDEVGGWRSECDFSQDYDLALRVTERTERIAHIPLPLYSWRMVPGSAASELRAKPKSVDAGKRALKDAMERRGVRAVVEDGPYRNTYRVRHLIEEQPLVSIIIPTRDRLDMLRPCITSIERKSTYPDYELVIMDNDSKEEETLRYLEAMPHRRLQYPGEFRYAAMMNYAVRETTGKYVILLNNDTAVLSDEWIEAMLEHAQRPGVAAVGARLLYPDGRPQHEGVVMGAGIGGSCLNVDTRGYFGLGTLVRNVSAVTAACMMVSRRAFEELDGFDESLRVAFNDVDYCLRALKAGYRVIYTPYATLVHHESASRGSLHPREDEEFFRRRWGKPGQYRDAYYNPNLSRATAYIIETNWPDRQEPQPRPPLAVATGARSR